jgi:thiol-disulfide isomerase/thioredoxin
VSDDATLEEPTEEQQTSGDEATPAQPGFMGPTTVVGREPEAVGTVPTWVPFALIGTLILGLVLGAGGALILRGDDEASDATAQAAAAPDDGVVAPSPAGTLPTAGLDDPDAYGTVELTGSPLPTFSATGGDPALGRPAPELVGADFAGNPVSITNDGQAKILLFLAHWCPYCQNEVPTVRSWLETTELPDNVDVYSVITLTEADRANYPPRPWLEAEGWSVPVVVDDGLDTAAQTFGLNAVPYWVFVNTDGTIAFRHAGGGVPAEALTEVAATLAEGPPQPATEGTSEDS